MRERERERGETFLSLDCVIRAGQSRVGGLTVGSSTPADYVTPLFHPFTSLCVYYFARTCNNSHERDIVNFERKNAWSMMARCASWTRGGRRLNERAKIIDIICNYVTIDHRSGETGRDIPLETLVNSNTRVINGRRKIIAQNLIIPVSVSSLTIDKSANESHADREFPSFPSRSLNQLALASTCHSILISPEAARYSNAIHPDCAKTD